MDIDSRLSELLQLKDGWIEGKGKAIDPSGAEWLLQGFRENYEATLPLPRLFPTLEGGVQAEWSLGVQEITVEFDLIKKTGFYQYLNSATLEELDEELDFSVLGTWQKLNEFLMKAMVNAA